MYIHKTMKKMIHKFERKECIDGRVLKDREEENNIIKF